MAQAHARLKPKSETSRLSDERPTRRYILTTMTGAAAAMPVAAIASASAMAKPAPTDDPVFTAVDRYQSALRAYEKACNESADDKDWDAPQAAYITAANALSTTVPTTPIGAAMVLNIVLKDMQEGEMLWHPEAFASVYAGLVAMEGGSDPVEIEANRQDVLEVQAS